MFTLISVFSVCCSAFQKNNLKTLFSLDFLFIINIFSQRRRVDNTPSALLQRTCGT